MIGGWSLEAKLFYNSPEDRFSITPRWLFVVAVEVSHYVFVAASCYGLELIDNEWSIRWASLASNKCESRLTPKVFFLNRLLKGTDVSAPCDNEHAVTNTSTYHPLSSKVLMTDSSFSTLRNSCSWGAIGQYPLDDADCWMCGDLWRGHRTAIVISQVVFYLYSMR